MKRRIIEFCVDHPKIITWIMVISTLVVAFLAVAPTIAPRYFPFLPKITIDTDPENMLAHDEPVRAFHDRMKKEFNIKDMVVVGVVDEKDPDGVFNPRTLKHVYELVEYAKSLQWPDPDHPGKIEGVITADIVSPSTVDNIEQAGPGTIRFEWLMPSPPNNKAEAISVKNKAQNIPFLNCMLLCRDGKALAIFLPITSKDISYKIAEKLKEKAATFSGYEEYHITGLPVAEDTFGVEMFYQMAISAPLATLAIFLLMLFFFKKMILIISPLIIAMVSAVITMGLLVISGNTIHIMSSMIPIFVMPIAVLDAVHILSDFFDRYQETRDRRKTIIAVMDHLFAPMLFTSLTTIAGFGSLALAPIPPVQVFGLFVAIGVALAWAWTITFIPAYVMFISPESLKDFGMQPHEEGEVSKHLLARLLIRTGRFTYKYARPIIAAFAIILVISAYGISKIRINDNPIKWFEPDHPIRKADQVMNKLLGGTYMAYLVLEPEKEIASPREYISVFMSKLDKEENKLKSEGIPGITKVFDKVRKKAASIALHAKNKAGFFEELEAFIEDASFDAPDAELDAWDQVSLVVSEIRQSDEIFKNPDMLAYIDRLQKYLYTINDQKGRPLVGKSNSIVEIVKTVYRELMGGGDANFKIPPSPQAVAQCLIQFQNSHRPQDLWHFVTPDYRKVNIWILLKSGDNLDMEKVAKKVEDYLATHTPPVKLKHAWFGLTYINVHWQQIMVKGMLNSLFGSFVTVLLMMIFLFRSFLWGFLCMVPLSVTITFIYGVIGLVGKDYDMPVAVLSSLSLGLAVDYAIHFLARSRELAKIHGPWSKTVYHVFGEPARAITRNVIVIGVGFLPLLLAPLVPYKTVGFFIASILVAAGVTTLILLPALITVLERFLFPQKKT